MSSGQMKACYGYDASHLGRVWTFLCTQDTAGTYPSGDYTVIGISNTAGGIGDCMYTSLNNWLTGNSVFHQKFIGGAKITVS